ncbi:hypothetical protein E0Z10_g8424 [Xylaria hypoxylon]|uniref:Uncharacterized protein n=1 Tax=Xylaria hypoxylon TaxID=37992 RepID=A0A4Z0YJN2_9PEZI|nr:hypothetical protein E0Z10_g8424 [Xylaria hypoxylon]
MNNESLLNNPPPHECSKELDVFPNKALALDHQPKSSKLQLATDIHQHQNPVSIKRGQKYDSPQIVNVTKISPRINNGLAKSRWADTTYNGTPISRTGQSPAIFSTPVQRQQRTTGYNQARMAFGKKIDRSMYWTSDEKRVSPVKNKTAVPEFGHNALNEQDNDTDPSSPNKSNHTQGNGWDEPGDVRNQTWESCPRLVTAVSLAGTTGDSSQASGNSTTSPIQAEWLGIGKTKLIDTVPDQRGKWSSVSDAVDEVHRSIPNQDRGRTLSPWKEPSDERSCSTGRVKVVPQHITDFIETWIRGAHVVKTDFLFQGIDQHEDCDVDTEKGVLMEKPVDYPNTRRPQEIMSRDQLEMTSALSMKQLVAEIARRDPKRKAQRKAEKEQRAAAAAAAAAAARAEAEAEAEAVVEAPPNLNEVQIPCHLRPAVESDMEAITAIYNQEILDGYKVMDTNPVRQEDFCRIYGQCLAERMPFVVAVEGWYGADTPHQGVIGFALVTAVSRGIAGSYETLSRCGGKLLVIVKPECRRKKVGTALIDILMTNCTGWYMSKGGYQFVNFTHGWISKEFGSNSRKWWYLEMDVMIRSDEDEEKTRKGEEFQWIWNFLEAKFDLLLKHYDTKCFCSPFEVWLDKLTFRRACKG